jgi:hypothetical protein
MAEKKITAQMTLPRFNVTTQPSTNRDGAASYELLKRALDTLDNWEESK